MSFPQIRQSIDGRYSIPYKHPLNDYFNIVGGYERETRDDIGPDVSLLTESAVLGVSELLKPLETGNIPLGYVIVSTA